MIRFWDTTTKILNANHPLLVQAMMHRVHEIDGVDQRIANLPRDWRIATTCSGSGAFELATRAVANAMSGQLPAGDESFVVSCLTVYDALVRAMLLSMNCDLLDFNNYLL